MALKLRLLATLKVPVILAIAHFTYEKALDRHQIISLPVLVGQPLRKPSPMAVLAINWVLLAMIQIFALVILEWIYRRIMIMAMVLDGLM